MTALRATLFVACLIPLAWLGWGLWSDTLGIHPIETAIRGLGDWALRFLLATLAISPLRKLTGWNWLQRLRRMLGLYAFFYATVHLATYLGVDQHFDWIAIAKDIIKRPFITVGMLAYVLMLPLAITSNNAMMRRLGGPGWQALHRSVYAVAIFAILHFWWMVKQGIAEPAIYTALLTLLLGTRALTQFRRKSR